MNKNAKENSLNIEIIYSDLFDSIKKQSFDYIIINPPYYPKKPESIKENAWFCGENFEYFERLFKQLENQLSLHINCFMILSEDCNIEKIKAIAKKNNLISKCIEQKTVIQEKNFIFKIEKTTQ